MSGFGNENADRDFGMRAAEYLRQQGLSEDQVRTALESELGFGSPEAEELTALSAAA